MRRVVMPSQMPVRTAKARRMPVLRINRPVTRKKPPNPPTS